MLGLISGQYIFGEPLREYWEENKRLEQANASKNSAASSSATDGPSNNTK